MYSNSPQIIIATQDEIRSLIKDAVREGISALGKTDQKTQEVLSEKQVAQYLSKKPGTLRQWRCDSKGPAYYKKGRQVLYRKDDVDAWLTSGKMLTFDAPGAPR